MEKAACDPIRSLGSYVVAGRQNARVAAIK
jgi:hypothetical protein